jgi:hypothetical protein
MATLPGISLRKVCHWLHFSRARLRARAVSAKVPPQLDQLLTGRIQCSIAVHPTLVIGGSGHCCASVKGSE